MRLRQILFSGIGVFALLGILGAGTVFAAPANSPNSQTVSLTCDSNSLDIDTVEIVTMDNNGHWTAGHIVAVNGDPANLTAIPLEFLFTATGTDPNGNPVTFTDDEVKPGNRNGVSNTITCSGTLGTFTDQDGTYTVDLTVTAFIAPEK